MKSEHASIMDKFVSASGIGAFDSYIHFAVMKGRQYAKQDRLRLMLVGHSTNGWLSMSTGLDSKSSGEDGRYFFSTEIILPSTGFIMFHQNLVSLQTVKSTALADLTSGTIRKSCGDSLAKDLTNQSQIYTLDKVR